MTEQKLWRTVADFEDIGYLHDKVVESEKSTDSKSKINFLRNYILLLESEVIYQKERLREYEKE